MGSTPMRSRHPPREEDRLVADRAPRPPSVERLLGAVRARAAISRGADPAAWTAAARDLIAEERRSIAGGATPRAVEDLADALVGRLTSWAGPTVPRTINATGVIVHTNLGRASWPRE